MERQRGEKMSREKKDKKIKETKFKSVYLIIGMFAIVIVVALGIALKNSGLLNFETITKPKQKHTLN